MSTIKANNIQIGQSATATQNFVLSVPASPDGTIKLSRGNQGATTADVVNVDANGNVGIGTSSPSKKLTVSDGTVTFIASPESTTTYIGNTTNHSIGLVTNGINRLLIAADGTINAGNNPITNCKTTAKAWVNFNGSTASVRSSYNVSSITKNGTGDYTVNFTTAMADANYSANVNRDVSAGSASIAGTAFGGTYSTTALQVRTLNGTALADSASVYVTIFGN